jgi:hypothetical protein
MIACRLYITMTLLGIALIFIGMLSQQTPFQIQTATKYALIIIGVAIYILGHAGTLTRPKIGVKVAFRVIRMLSPSH